ncbi:hypothetical protein D9757_011076 [Collybiopsis confluens]|uniref:Coenzyme Q-binding protein COQ10 START domain-containing protein n=1 Tax=Collybiopsis confluens TaxID=2823264 RepID=A0A8H5GPZ0_9AGAR|nr:hypothetical protein D9757_011076 [Collybiopsis confluens]
MMVSHPTTGILHVSTSILIDAPITKVWSTLLDFKSYPQWNPFRHQQVIISPETKEPLTSQNLSEGSVVLTEVHMPPSMQTGSGQQRTVECIVLDPINYRQAWTSTDFPRWLLYPVRWDILTTEGGMTKYESFESVNGILAYFLYYFMQDSLQLAHNEMAKALKNRVEL